MRKARQNNANAKPNIDSIRTQEKLSSSNCQNAFQNMLRTGDPVSGHVETKIRTVPLRVNRRRDQVSHIFTGEDPSTVKASCKKGIYIPDRVMFNDYYVESNPRINPEKRTRYIMERSLKAYAKQQYSDELNMSQKRRQLMNRKVDEYYMHNPLKVYDQKEIAKYNQEQYDKGQKHSQAFHKTFGSDNYKRALGYGNDKYRKIEDYNQSNKVTANNFDITRRALNLNKNEEQKVPYYGRSHFRYASCGRGQAYSYA